MPGEQSKGMHLRLNTALSVVEVASTAAVLLLLYRVMLQHLSLSQVGVWSLVVASASAARLGDLGLTNSVTRFVAIEHSAAKPHSLAILIESSVLCVACLYGALAAIAYGPIWWLLSRAVSGADLVSARALLPYSLLSLTLMSIAGAAMSSLSGLQRSYLKSSITVVGNIVLLLGAISLVSSMELIGVAIAQIAQMLCMLVLSWAALRTRLPELRLAPTRLKWHALRPVFKYGLKVQFTSIAGFFFEPVTKMLMARYGGTTALGMYEVALRVVTQARAFLVTANQALVPSFVRLYARNPADAFDLLGYATRLTTLATCLALGAITLLHPFIASLLLGHRPSQFGLFVGVLCVAWGANTLLTPIYMLAMATGHLRYNLLSHVAIAVVSPAAAWLLGLRYGAPGVLFGAMAGLLAGTFVLALSYPLVFRRLRSSSASGETAVSAAQPTSKGIAACQQR